MFTIDQKIFVLQQNGYEVKSEAIAYTEEYYRNAPEVVNRKVWQVYQQGKPLAFDFAGRADDAQVNSLFNKVASEKLIKILAE